MLGFGDVISELTRWPAYNLMAVTQKRETLKGQAKVKVVDHRGYVSEERILFLVPSLVCFSPMSCPSTMMVCSQK